MSGGSEPVAQDCVACSGGLTGNGLASHRYFSVAPCRELGESIAALMSNHEGKAIIHLIEIDM